MSDDANVVSNRVLQLTRLIADMIKKTKPLRKEDYVIYIPSPTTTSEHDYNKDDHAEWRIDKEGVITIVVGCFNPNYNCVLGGRVLYSTLGDSLALADVAFVHERLQNLLDGVLDQKFWGSANVQKQLDLLEKVARLAK